MNLESLLLLGPEILLSAFALILLAADVCLPARHGRILFHFAMFCALLTLAMLGLSVPSSSMPAGGLWVADPLSMFFKVLILLTTVLTLLLTLDYPLAGSAHLGSFSALVLFATLGMMLLVSSVDLLLIFLSLELISISSFVLTGFHRKDLRSSEGALKYFLIGAFSAAVMVFGISLYYGATGTTRLTTAPELTPMLMFALLLLTVGFGFKASIAPFHLWVPDAYEGAPTPVTAYLSIAPKIAALALMVRVFLKLLPGATVELASLFSFLAMLTMTVGNLTAIFQTNVKRLLAYSSIAQAGYILIGFVAGGPRGIEGVLMYSLVYLFMNIGAFAIAILVGNEGSYELEAYDGLAQRNLPAALLMTFFLLSLAGIPPLAGFIAKLYVFSAAIEAKLYALAVVGLINSVISVYYYLLIAYHMFFRPARDPRPIPAGTYLTWGLAAAALGIFVLGLYPDPFIATVRESAVMLPR